VCQSKLSKTGPIDFNALQPDFESGLFDNELKQTHNVEFKAPYWQFIKDFQAKQVELKDDQAAKDAVKALDDMAKELETQQKNCEMTNLKVLMDQFQKHHCLALKAWWTKNRRTVHESIKQSQEMWDSRQDEIARKLSDQTGSCFFITFHCILVQYSALKHPPTVLYRWAHLCSATPALEQPGLALLG